MFRTSSKYIVLAIKTVWSGSDHNFVVQRRIIWRGLKFGGGNVLSRFHIVVLYLVNENASHEQAQPVKLMTAR